MIRRLHKPRCFFRTPLHESTTSPPESSTVVLAPFRSVQVRCFFTQLQSLTLIDPGYGEHWETQDHLALSEPQVRVPARRHARSHRLLGVEEAASFGGRSEDHRSPELQSLMLLDGVVG